MRNAGRASGRPLGERLRNVKAKTLFPLSRNGEVSHVDAVLLRSLGRRPDRQRALPKSLQGKVFGLRWAGFKKVWNRTLASTGLLEFF